MVQINRRLYGSTTKLEQRGDELRSVTDATGRFVEDDHLDIERGDAAPEKRGKVLWDC